MSIQFAKAKAFFETLADSAPEGIVVVSDSNVVALPYFKQAIPSHPQLLATIVLPAGEASKSWHCVQHLIHQLSSVQASRKTALVSIGGGMVSDIAGFAAAIYRRGMPFYTLPTTLLAQIDAAIGGKNGINTEFAKNAVGTFYHPTHIVIDDDFLHTLPQREFHAAFAEMIKYGLIADAAFFAWIEENVAALRAKESAVLHKAIKRCIDIKCHLVAQDEKEEKGIRQLLNFGHTLGHAIESASHFAFLHGEAIAIGMVQAARLSQAKGFIAQQDLGRIINLLAQFELPTEIPAIPAQRLIDFMQHDKKNQRTVSKIIILKNIGSAEIIAEKLDSFSENFDYP